MSTTGSMSPLQRKMAAGRDAAESIGRSAAAALRLAIARAADDLFDLALVVIGVSQARVTQDELAPHLPQDRLLVMLDGPEGQFGILTLDRMLLTALIQQQTMGQISGMVPDDRPFTSTDASLAAPLVDEMLTRAADLADKPIDIQCLSGFRFGARAEDARSAMLSIEAERFRLFELTLEFGSEGKQGVLTLVLPEPIKAATGQEVEADSTAPKLGAAIEMARADLTAVICTMRVSLSDLSAMAPGDVLPLVKDHLDRTELVGITGQPVAVGRLGQIGGLRALRLNETKLRMTRAPDQSGFAADIGAQPSVANDPDVLEGELAPSPPTSPDVPSKPVTRPHRPEEDEDGDDPFSNMSAEEAALEISALAGLSPDDIDAEDNSDLPMTIG